MIEQLDSLPEGDYQAVLVLEETPETLEGQGVAFAEGQDDLDAFVWAAIVTEGGPVVLMRHVNSQEEGVTVWSELEPTSALGALRGELDIAAEPVWRADQSG